MAVVNVDALATPEHRLSPNRWTMDSNRATRHEDRGSAAARSTAHLVPRTAKALARNHLHVAAFDFEEKRPAPKANQIDVAIVISILEYEGAPLSMTMVRPPGQRQIFWSSLWSTLQPAMRSCAEV